MQICFQIFPRFIQFTTIDPNCAGRIFADAAVVVDVCVNENGEKAFLLGKGGKPAKQFHLLTNPAHEMDPWYYESELQYPFVTSEGEFKKGSLRHPTYLD